MSISLILQSWYENLQFFDAKNLKIFSLIVLKTFIESYKTIFKNLWILFSVLGIAYFSLKYSGLTNYLMYVGMYFWIFFLSLSIRASVHLKDAQYFYSYLLKYGIQFAVLALLDFYLDYKFLLLTVFIIWLNFIYDDLINIKNLFYSFERALLMVTYNLPIIGLIAFLLFVVKLVAGRNFWFIYKLDIINYMITLPLFLSFIINFYIKRVHEQFLIYYK